MDIKKIFFNYIEKDLYNRIKLLKIIINDLDLYFPSGGITIYKNNQYIGVVINNRIYYGDKTFDSIEVWLGYFNINYIINEIEMITCMIEDI